MIEAGENAIEHLAPPRLLQWCGGLCLLEKMVTQTGDVNDIELVFSPLGQWVSGVQDETEGFPLEFGDKHEGNSIGTGERDDGAITASDLDEGDRGVISPRWDAERILGEVGEHKILRPIFPANVR